jgi:hypothetical protein
MYPLEGFVNKCAQEKESNNPYDDEELLEQTVPGKPLIHPSTQLIISKFLLQHGKIRPGRVATYKVVISIIQARQYYPNEYPWPLPCNEPSERTRNYPHAYKYQSFHTKPVIHLYGFGFPLTSFTWTSPTCILPAALFAEPFIVPIQA